MDPEALKNLSPQQQGEIMQAVQQQVALQNMQELLQKVTDKCFKKCITSPGTSLGKSDQGCIAMCMDRSVLSPCCHSNTITNLVCRYMDSFNIVSKAYTNKLMQERNKL